MNADGHDDVITGAGAGGGPHVRVLSGADGSQLHGFFAYAPSFLGGVRVAAVDADGDGRADIVTGAGPGGGPHVRILSGRDRSVLASQFAYDPAFTGGVFVAGDLAEPVATVPRRPPIRVRDGEVTPQQNWELIRAAALLSNDEELDLRPLPGSELVDAAYAQWQ